jgi:hypothetical protein
MRVVKAKIQTVEDMYRLIWTEVACTDLNPYSTLQAPDAVWRIVGTQVRQIMKVTHLKIDNSDTVPAYCREDSHRRWDRLLND